MSNLTSAKMELTFKYPFFSSILLKRMIKEQKEIPTMAISDDGTIYYNPSFIEGLTLDELVFVLAHEVMHYACMHGIRRGNRDPEIWNYAADLFVNSFLISSHVGRAPKGILFKPKSETRTTEEIYSELCQQQREKNKKTKVTGEVDSSNVGGNPRSSENQKQIEKSPENCKGDEPLRSDLPNEDGTTNSEGSENKSSKEKFPVKGKGKDPLSGDLLNEGEKTDAERSEIESQTKLDIAGAREIAKCRGTVPGSLLRLVDSLLVKKTPWYELLEKFFMDLTNQKQSWRRPNRRFASLDTYLPSTDKEASMGTVVIGIDTSGSITEKMLQYFGGHLNAIIEQCHPEKVFVVYCDARIQRVEEFEKDDYPITFKPIGGGGTDMRKIVRWVKKEDLEPDVLLILTDGYTLSDCEPTCPLIWATTGVETFSCGEVIKIDSND